jgi:hypothetical protein
MKLFLKNKNNFLVKNHCEIQVRTILVCTLYSIKYGTLKTVLVKWVGLPELPLIVMFIFEKNSLTFPV